MYESHWHFNAKPFDTGCDARFYYPGPSHQAALLKLRYAIESQRGGAILAGPSGSGKTFLVGMLRSMLAPRFAPFVHVVFPHMSTEELLGYLAGELAAQPVDSQAPAVHQSVRRIERFLAENSARGQHAVIALDEAHLLGDGSTWEALRLLLNFETSGRPGLTLLLVGQTGLLPILDRIPHLEERLGVKCLLRALTPTETAEYVAHRLRVAGSQNGAFEPDALHELHRLTHGIPRRINRLCDLALLIGYAEGRKSIAAAELESIHQELVAVVPE